MKIIVNNKKASIMELLIIRIAAFILGKKLEINLIDNNIDENFIMNPSNKYGFYYHDNKTMSIH